MTSFTKAWSVLGVEHLHMVEFAAAGGGKT